MTAPPPNDAMPLSSLPIALPEPTVVPRRHAQGEVSKGLLRASYAELYRLAVSLVAENPDGRTVDARALANEAARRTLGAAGVQELEDRAGYFAYLANALRRMIGELAIQHDDSTGVQVCGPGLAAGTTISQMISALNRLESKSTLHAQIAVLRMLGGLSSAEVAQQMGISERRARIGWRRVCEWMLCFSARMELRAAHQRNAM